MSEAPSWQYDEMEQVGKAHGDVREVEAYDARHGKFRDVETENVETIEALRLRPDDSLIELGCGTGAFPIQAAQHCAHVCAVDVSRAVLDYARAKAEQAGLDNISFHHGGFLTYSHAGGPVAAVVTSAALHHLPDLWKAVALARLNAMLTAGGSLFIADVVFPNQGILESVSRWIAKLGAIGGKGFRQDAETHVREEYSTLQWIMEGLLTGAGFEIQDMKTRGGCFVQYLCRKKTDAAQQPRPAGAGKPPG